MKKIILSVILATSLFSCLGVDSNNTDLNPPQEPPITTYSLPNQH